MMKVPSLYPEQVQVLRTLRKKAKMCVCWPPVQLISQTMKRLVVYDLFNIILPL